jgi:hypothetical protein
MTGSPSGCGTTAINTVARKAFVSSKAAAPPGLGVAGCQRESDQTADQQTSYARSEKAFCYHTVDSCYFLISPLPIASAYTLSIKRLFGGQRGVIFAGYGQHCPFMHIMPDRAANGSSDRQPGVSERLRQYTTVSPSSITSGEPSKQVAISGLCAAIPLQRGERAQ